MVHLFRPLLKRSGYFFVALIAQLSKKLLPTHMPGVNGFFSNHTTRWSAGWRGTIASTSSTHVLNWKRLHFKRRCFLLFLIEIKARPTSPLLQPNFLGKYPIPRSKWNTRYMMCTLAPGCTVSLQIFDMVFMSAEAKMWLELSSSPNAPDDV